MYCLSVTNKISRKILISDCQYCQDVLFQKDDTAFTYEVIVVDDGSKDKTTEVRLAISCILSVHE